jgi:hypothetical protein
MSFGCAGTYVGEITEKKKKKEFEIDCNYQTQKLIQLNTNDVLG